MILLKCTLDGSVCPWEYFPCSEESMFVGMPLALNDGVLESSTRPEFISAALNPVIDAIGQTTYPAIRIHDQQVWAGYCDGEVAVGDSVGIAEDGSFVVGGSGATVTGYDPLTGEVTVTFAGDSGETSDVVDIGLVDYMILGA